MVIQSLKLPAVYLHGFLGSPEDWEPLFRFLPKDRERIAIELPGHGNTPFSPNWDCPFPKAHLVGYSMGGRIAAMFADQYPERVASLTLLSAHPGLKTEAEKQTRLQQDERWAHLLNTLPIESFLEQWYAQPLFASHKPDFNKRMHHNVEELTKAFLHYSLARQKILDMKKILVGEWDSRFRALHPHAIVIEKAGHQIHLENPEAVAKYL